MENSPPSYVFHDSEEDVWKFLPSESGVSVQGIDEGIKEAAPVVGMDAAAVSRSLAKGRSVTQPIKSEATVNPKKIKRCFMHF